MTADERYAEVARLHAANLDQGFLTTLGERVLAELYRAIDTAPGGVLFCVERDGRVVGFVSAAAGMAPIYRAMLRRPFTLALALLPSLLHPGRAIRIAEILVYSGRNSESSNVEMPTAELLSIAVHPSARGSGAAESLYRQLVEHFAAEGRRAFRIIVGNGLTAAHRFYVRMGARPVMQMHVHRGSPSTLYIHEVVPATHQATESGQVESP